VIPAGQVLRTNQLGSDVVKPGAELTGQHRHRPFARQAPRRISASVIDDDRHRTVQCKQSSISGGSEMSKPLPHRSDTPTHGLNGEVTLSQLPDPARVPEPNLAAKPDSDEPPPEFGGTTKFSTVVDESVLDEVKDAFWFARHAGRYRVLGDLITDALRDKIAALRSEFNAGGPFPKRPVENLPPGRLVR
jgi:hypothetical protein